MTAGGGHGGSSSGKRFDPLTIFCFKLVLDEVPGMEGAEAYFQSVSGIKYESEVISYKEGGLNNSTHQLVGPGKWPNLVLKKGFTGGSFALLSWRMKWMSDDTETRLERVSGQVIQLGPRPDMKICSWRFTNGWPCAWEGPDFDASRSELAIETLEIAHEGLEFEDLGGSALL
jgi:phage tail-like protein